MYEATTEEVLIERERLQGELDRESIGIKLLVGREYYLDEFLLEFIRRPLLMEGTNCIMIEIPSHSSVDLVKETLFAVSRSGYTPFIAHPERCRLMEMGENESNNKSGWKALLSRSTAESSNKKSGNDLLEYLKRLGCLFQANLGSFNGQYGAAVRTNARNLEKKGVYEYAGTDAHSPETIRELFSIK
jgi:protein-tyrosine phosphatase